jgi:hypothetical protein
MEAMLGRGVVIVRTDHTLLYHEIGQEEKDEAEYWFVLKVAYTRTLKWKLTILNEIFGLDQEDIPIHSH